MINSIRVLPLLPETLNRYGSSFVVKLFIGPGNAPLFLFKTKIKGGGSIPILKYP